MRVGDLGSVRPLRFARASVSYILGDRFPRIYRPHFIGPLVSAIDHHAIVKTDHRSAAGAHMEPRKRRVNETRSRAAQHGPAEAQCVAPVLKVRFAHRRWMIREQVTNASKCHDCTPHTHRTKSLRVVRHYLRNQSEVRGLTPHQRGVIAPWNQGWIGDPHGSPNTPVPSEWRAVAWRGTATG